VRANIPLIRSSAAHRATKSSTSAETAGLPEAFVQRSCHEPHPLLINPDPACRRRIVSGPCLQLDGVTRVQQGSSGVIRPNGLEPHQRTTRIARLDTELHDRFGSVDGDILDLSAGNDLRNPSQIGAGIPEVLAEDVLHGFIDVAGRYCLDVRICRAPDRPLIHRPQRFAQTRAPLQPLVRGHLRNDAHPGNAGREDRSR